MSGVSSYIIVLDIDTEAERLVGFIAVIYQQNYLK